jgi:hypothetical protein
MKMSKVNFVTRNEAWEVIKNLPNVHTFVFLVYSVLARVTKKDRKTGEVHAYPNLKKTVAMQTSINSDYKTRIENQLIREGKELTDYKAGKNTMPIDFISENKVAGEFDGKRVFCHYPIKNGKTRIIGYSHEGKEVSKKDIEGLDIFPLPYKPTNQGIEEKTVQINKLYFDHLISFTVNKVRYVIV